MAKQREEINTSAWMNTYADLVTLLLCFFVLLYSMSVVDAVKWQEFAKAFQDLGRDPDEVLTNIDPDSPPGTPVNAAGSEGSDSSSSDSNSSSEESSSDSESEGTMDLENPKPETFDDLYDYLVSYTEQQGMEEDVSITKGETSIYIRFNNNIFFFPDSSAIKEESIPTLDFIGDCFSSVQDQIYLININGHTASVLYEYYPMSSWTLSAQRASNIAIYMEDEKGIDPRKLRPIGYSENYPIAPNDTEENRRLNRRVDIVIVSNEVLSGEFYDEFAGLFDPSTFPQEGGLDDIMVPGSEDSGDGLTAVPPPPPRDFSAPSQPDSILPVPTS